MSDTTTPQGVPYARWQEDKYKESQWTYGNWGGKGWSMGQFNRGGKNNLVSRLLDDPK